MTYSKTIRFPQSRIATIDVCEAGKQKHHIAAMIELDVTDVREKIKRYKNQTGRISFNAWLIKSISTTVKSHELSTAYLKGKRQAVIFDDINISIVVEKQINGHKVPMPMVLEKVNEVSMESITRQINDAKNQELTGEDIVLQKKTKRMERLYYYLPGFIRRSFWKFMLKHPHFAFKKMGNVAITSIGMMGNVKGWFIPVSVHPICFGISTINKKPAVVNNQIAIREMLNMTVLIDHDVIDGAAMARFIHQLSVNIENGIELENN